MHSTGLESTTFGATIRRSLFPGAATCCRINLSEPIFLLTAGHCCLELRSEWCHPSSTYKGDTSSISLSLLMYMSKLTSKFASVGREYQPPAPPAHRRRPP